MSRVRRGVAATWRFLDQIGWIIAIVFVAIALYKLHHDEQANKKSGEHTKIVQVQGGPPAVCLREGIERALPALERLPGTGPPFQAYVRLQQHRYPGVVCPDK
jgi:hypothetical protein